jgi:hypothetical protein
MDQHMISNLLQIKDLLLLNSSMEIVCTMAEVFQLIFKEQHIIIDFPQKKDFLMLNSIMAFVWTMAEVFQWI